MYNLPYSPFPTAYPPGLGFNPGLGMGFGPGSMFPKKPNNKLVIGFLIGTIVLVIIVLVVNIVMYTSKKGLFAPYKPPVPPANSVSPNGNPTVKALNPIPPVIKTTGTNNLNQWGQSGPQTQPTQFGPKTTA